MISSKSTEAILPEVVYFLAIWATSLRLCSISRSLACVSPSLHLWIYSDSSSSLSGFGKEAKVPRKKAVNGAHPSKAVFYILCGLQKKCERFLQKKAPKYHGGGQVKSVRRSLMVSGAKGGSYLLVYISVFVPVSEIMAVSDVSGDKVVHLVLVQIHIAVVIVIFIVIQIIFAHFTA